ncbi:hypothetical protein GQ53DRAFT_344990 [Thozetella sp. PMI_491]|nr:hypothetical protein GQ53DRAFT_344990 [Thozetella sp. PMI_491]
MGPCAPSLCVLRAPGDERSLSFPSPYYYYPWLPISAEALLPYRSCTTFFACDRSSIHFGMPSAASMADSHKIFYAREAEGLQSVNHDPLSMPQPLYPATGNYPVYAAPAPQGGPYPPNPTGSPWDASTAAAHPSTASEKEAVPEAGAGGRKMNVWLALSLVGNVLLIIAVVVVGVVLGKKSSDNTASPSANSTSCPAAQNTTCPTLAPTKNICFATNSSDASGFIRPGSECPLSNDQRLYTVPNTNLTFRRECNIDYPSNDLGKYPTSSMADCLAFCAQLNIYPTSILGPCKGVVWVTGEGAGDDQEGRNVSFCFPKYAAAQSGPRDGCEAAWLA